jgi:multidrug efflux pump subunit AcrB
VLLFLGSLRQTLIIVLAIPLAILVAVLLIRACLACRLNVFSLGGLALGVGIVVDNSIVMLENIAKGAETHYRAALSASANGNGNGNGRNRDESPQPLANC